jgi:excisionase family DNA binding protein
MPTHANKPSRRGSTVASVAQAMLGDLATKPTLTVMEAADILGISDDSYRRAARNGDLPLLRIRHRTVVPTMALLELLGLTQAEAE